MYDSSVGGADTFVFGSANGLATIADFRSGDGDLIDFTAAVNLSAAPLTWADLDTNGNNVLDDGDNFVSVGAFTDDGVAGDDTAIDLGAAAGGTADENVVTVAGITGLMEGDLLFA